MSSSLRAVSAATLAAVFLFPACYSDLKKQNEAYAGKIHQLENDLQQARAERDESRAREKTIEQQASASEEAARLAHDQPVAAAPAAAAPTHADSDVAHATSASPALAKKLESSLASVKAQVDMKDGRVRIVLPGTDAFGAGSADLSANGKKVCRDVGKAIAAALPKDGLVWVVGHTDADPPKKSKGKFHDNRELSFARASAVVDVLASAGVPQKRLVPAGYGEFAPVAAGKSEQEKAKNRRVEIWIE
ncbi:MAG TPA: OmpA family protein [Planctomycetota bacterium]|nr:OmpA family protein [Planctomycetota bacterium]